MRKQLTLGLAAALAIVSLAPATYAHRVRSKIYGPAGTWTYGPDVPHIHDAPAPPTPKGYGSVRIRNNCRFRSTFTVRYQNLSGEWTSGTTTLGYGDTSQAYHTKNRYTYIKGRGTSGDVSWSEREKNSGAQITNKTYSFTCPNR